MGDFLTEVKTVTLRQKSQPDKPLLEEVPVARPLIQAERAAINSPDDVLEILRSRPDTDTLEDVLIYLSKRQRQDGFNIRVPGPSSAKIINELISTTIPDFWDNVDGLKHLLLDTLRSIAGISAALAKLRLLVSQYKPTKQAVKSADVTRPISDLISVLSQLLGPDDVADCIFSDITRLVDNQIKRDLLWKEYLASVASGRVISAVAEAETVTNTTESIRERSWLSDGPKYSAWLGRNAARMIQKAADSSDRSAIKSAAQLCGKAFNIGYPARVVEELHSQLSLSNEQPISRLEGLIDNLQPHEQRQFLQLTTKFLGKQTSSLLLPSDYEEDVSSAQPAVRGATTLLRSMLCNQTMKDHLAAWLSDASVNSNDPFAIRRAAISAMATTGGTRSIIDEDPMEKVLESNWKLFGDNLFIKHTPVLQQEACAQILLMAAGYIHRIQPMFLFTLARSSLHLNGTSNRLNSSSPRARFLGMIVGMAISKLVDKEGSKLTFDVEDTKTPEAGWYLRLTEINDSSGSVEEMRKVLNTTGDKSLATKMTASSRRTQTSKTARTKVAPKIQSDFQGPRVMEVLDDDEEDDDLVPYAKPDSDPEDEDEDPTLVNRNKPKAPVYIRDLISALHDTENFERHSIALKSAASLIRRKSSFGKEVSDHAIEIALIIIGLSNTFDIEDFSELRLQALIATLLSNPAQLAPWFAGQIFDGDYSLSQRATMISVLGLGARELAGYKDEDEELNPKLPSTSFPSKQLPPHLHKLYAAQSEKDRTTLIATRLQNSFIKPIAAKAADDLSGPNILKVRTFSSRMEVEKRRKKPIANALAKIVAQSFFFPLTSRWWQNTQAYGSSHHNIHFQPFLLSTYLKTLAILLHASGPSTLLLQQMTVEFWELLLNVRSDALADVSVLEAVLFCFLTLLEVNEDKRVLAEECARQLMETQGWVELVFEKSSGGGGRGGDAEGEKIRMLAAGVLVKTRDVVDKYQRLLVGSMMDY